MFSYCTIDEFFNYWNIVNDEEIKSSINLTFKGREKRIIFLNNILGYKREDLKNYSRRQL